MCCVQQSLIHEEQKLNGEMKPQSADSRINAGQNTSALVGQLNVKKNQDAITVVMQEKCITYT